MALFVVQYNRRYIGWTSITWCCDCYTCVNRAMLDQREPPRCRGLELEVGAPRDRVEALKNRARTSYIHTSIANMQYVYSFMSTHSNCTCILSCMC